MVVVLPSGWVEVGVVKLNVLVTVLAVVMEAAVVLEVKMNVMVMVVLGLVLVVCVVTLRLNVEGGMYYHL